jgi:TRAP-type C4-dicarboxylate transport system permease small subunit
VKLFIDRCTALGDKLRKAEAIFCTFLIGVIVIIITLQVLSRNFFSYSIQGLDAIVRMMTFYIAMFGAILATHFQRHISIDTFSRFASAKYRYFLECIIDIWCLIIALSLFYFSLELVQSSFEFGDIYTGEISLWILQLIIPYMFFNHFMIHLMNLINTLARKK